MAITDWPDTATLRDTLVCSMCQRHISRSQASVGPDMHDGRQTFVCTMHFQNTTCLVQGWTDFVLSVQIRRTVRIAPDDLRYLKAEAYGPDLR